MSATLGARVVPLGPVATASFVVGAGDAARVTVILKATFELVAERAGDVAAPIDVALEDVRGPLGSAPDPGDPAIVVATDLVPYLPGAGVILRGAAHAMFAIATPAMAVRLAIHDETDWVLEKTVHVFGDRTLSAPTPKSFVSMPLVYERAFGGREIEDNPVGVGAGMVGALPNVVDPDDPRRPIGFGPIAPTWASRKRLLHGALPPRIEGGVMRLEEGVDGRFFHAAPPDQQIRFLRGNEWIVLTGLRPEAPRFRAQLPSARGRARFRSARSSGEIELFADTLFIDAERPSASIVWRGQIALEEGLTIFAGVERPGRSIAWPSEASPTAIAAPSKPMSRTEEEPTGPIVIGDLGALLARRAIAPFDLAAPRAEAAEARPSSAAIPGAPWSREPAAPPPANRSSRRSTLPPPMLEPDETAAPVRFVGLPAPPPMLGSIAPTKVDAPDIDRARRDADAAEDPGRARVTLRLERFESLDGVDAENADLTGLDLSGKSLIGACLRGAKLDRAKLVGATLAAADLRGASLEDAALTDADLHGADLSRASLKGAALDRANLSGAKLVGAQADDAIFDGANGPAVDFTGASLIGVSFCDVDFPGARFNGAKLDGARFDGASIVKAVFVRAKGEDVGFDGAKMSGARLAKSELTGASFRHAELKGANAENAVLDGASFDGADLTRASLARASCVKATFHGADLTRARLVRLSAEGADFREASLDSADLRKAQLVGASLCDVAMHRGKVDRANLKRADLTGADVRGSSFAAALLTDATCSFVRFEGVNLRDADLRGASLQGASLEGADTEGALRTTDAEARMLTEGA